jgi:hypothetical protein
LAERSRRWLKAPFRKGVGSNPTGVSFAQRDCVKGNWADAVALAVVGKALGV